MDKSKMVMDIIGSQLNSAGFIKISEDEGSWVFTKTERYLDQHIDIIDIAYQEVGIYFQTNVPQDGIIKTLSAKDIMPKSKYKGKEEGFFPYHSDSEFCELLKMFKKIIIDFGMDALDRLSTPLPKGRITLETEEFLYINHSSLAEKFANQLNINISDMEHDLENMQIVANRIEILSRKEFHLIEQELIGLAAVYGTLLEKKLHWEWLLPPVGICFVTDINHNITQPLRDTFKMWEHGADNSLMNRYEELIEKDKNKINVDTPPPVIMVDNS